MQNHREFNIVIKSAGFRNYPTLSFNSGLASQKGVQYRNLSESTSLFKIISAFSRSTSKRWHLSVSLSASPETGKNIFQSFGRQRSAKIGVSPEQNNPPFSRTRLMLTWRTHCTAGPAQGLTNQNGFTRGSARRRIDKPLICIPITLSY